MTTVDRGLEACFSRDYAQARASFLAAARERGLEVRSALLPDHRGAADEDLAIDSVLLGDPDARQLLMVSSGIHGVEGFCGSGCQLALLGDRELTARIDASRHAVLVVHALNPHGFSHLRRVNEDNVDLNRNFVDFDAPPRNDAYARVHELLLPPRRPGPINAARLGLATARLGLPTIQAAISSGQYSHPEGMFFGGQRPSFTNLELRALLRRHARARDRLLWLDLHTGLGRRGACERILLAHDDPGDAPVARAIWGRDGAAITSAFDGSSTSAPLHGTPVHAIAQECPGLAFVGLTLEFGTWPLPLIFLALQRDHWLTNHPDAAGLAAARRRLRDAFYVDRPRWRAKVWRACRATIVDALDAMDRA